MPGCPHTSGFHPAQVCSSQRPWRSSGFFGTQRHILLLLYSHADTVNSTCKRKRKKQQGEYLFCSTFCTQPQTALGLPFTQIQPHSAELPSRFPILIILIPSCLLPPVCMSALKGKKNKCVWGEWWWWWWWCAWRLRGVCLGFLAPGTWFLSTPPWLLPFVLASAPYLSNFFFFFFF